jgi:hypothetical protein
MNVEEEFCSFVEWIKPRDEMRLNAGGISCR